jgi:C4-type Zn-finger protein|tara:strand:- start:33 stop:287 length:255 start_codon:yes stop_codon:yes gene_type:complete
MALKYNINMFETDPDDASKTFVTLIVTDDAANTFVISKSVTTGSNTDAQIIKAAQTAAQTEIDNHFAKFATVGKTWNPDTESIE